MGSASQAGSSTASTTRGAWTHVAPVVALLSASYLGWHTRAEHLANPNTVQMTMSVGDRLVVPLAHRFVRARS
jgi:hypothetical protein